MRGRELESGRQISHERSVIEVSLELIAKVSNTPKSRWLRSALSMSRRT